MVGCQRLRCRHTTTLDRHRQMHLRSRSPSQHPRLRTLRSRKPPKQRSSSLHSLSVSCAELLKQWCFFCSFAHVFSICAGHSRSDVQLGAQFTYLAWNKFGNEQFQWPIPPPHIHINQKNLFGALSPIGPISRHLSSLYLFS